MISLGSTVGTRLLQPRRRRPPSRRSTAPSRRSRPQRATLGAVQNRLEYSLQNVGIYQENLVAAESRIRDVDMAAETVTMTKNQILAQAGTAMLAQANQAGQGVLSLLR